MSTPVRKKKEAQIAGLATRLLEKGAAQEAAVRSLREALHQRSFSAASSVLHSMGGLAEHSVFHITCEKKWNLQLQRICHSEKLGYAEKLTAINEFQKEFEAFCGVTVEKFLDQYLSEDSSKIEWATASQLTHGEYISLVMLECDDNSAAAAAMKEQIDQMMLLSHQLATMEQPLLHVFPRVIVHYKGRTILAKTDIVNLVEPVENMNDLQVSLSLFSEAHQLAPYRDTRNGADHESLYRGPPTASCIPGADGYVYIKSLDGLFPSFPPARGTALGNKHTVRIRPEVLLSGELKHHLSPAAFKIFGSRDSATHNGNVRNSAKHICQVNVPRAASAIEKAAGELEKQVDSTDGFAGIVDPAHKKLLLPLESISKEMHAHGVNIAMMGLLLSYLELGSVAYRSVLTEMVCRVGRDDIRSHMCTRIESDEIQEAVGEFCAALNGEETRQALWEENIIPRMTKKFMAFSMLFSSTPSVEHVNREAVIARLEVMLGIKFANGVNASGTSAFHYCIVKSMPKVHTLTIPTMSRRGVLMTINASSSPFSPHSHHRDSAVTIISPQTESLIQSQGEEGVNEAESVQGFKFPMSPASSAHSSSFDFRETFIQDGAEEHAIRFVNARQREIGSHSVEMAVAALDMAALLRRKNLLSRAETVLQLGYDAIKGSKANDSFNGSILHGMFTLEKGLLKAAGKSFGDAVSLLNEAYTYFAESRNQHPAPLSMSQSEGNSGKVAATPTASERDMNDFAGSSGSTMLPGKSIYAATAAIALANLYEDHALKEEAEPLRRYVLSTYRALYGSVDEAVSTALNDLAVNLFSQDQLREAEDLFREDLRVSEILYGKEHLNVANTLNNLACLLDKMGENDESEAFFRRDIEISSKALGDTHPDVATSRNNLASSLLEREKFDAAEALFKEALKCRKEHFGDNHVVVAETLNNIGALYKRKKQRQQAKVVWNEALAIYEATVGKNHHSLQQLLENMQTLAEEMEEVELAENYMERLMDLKRAENDIYTAQQSAVK